VYTKSVFSTAQCFPGGNIPVLKIYLSSLDYDSLIGRFKTSHLRLADAKLFLGSHVEMTCVVLDMVVLSMERRE
jgi:hypothetical protein